MKTIEFLNNCGVGGEASLEILKGSFGIKYRVHPDYDNLIVLNYDQIDSAKHKFHDIVKECRSLVVWFNPETGLFEVVSRSFDRFFNYGESDLEVRMEDCVAYEKLDGSLVSVFKWKGEWLYRTKSVIMPVDAINGLEVTWDSLIEGFISQEDLEYLSDKCFILDTDTLICELTSPANRVVVKYGEEPQFKLLSIRNKEGWYDNQSDVDAVAKKLGWGSPRRYYFESFAEAQEAAKALPNLEEGFVLYHIDNDAPVLKMKNPAYVEAHLLRGEGVLNAKRVCNLIIMGEVDEYLSVFPEDAKVVQPYIDAYEALRSWIKCEWALNKDIEDKKEFALEVKDFHFSSVLFMMKNQGLTLDAAWNKLSNNAKREMICKGV